MAVCNWLSRALARAQLETITIAATWAANDTATITINGKACTFTAAGSSTTTIATGLYNSLIAMTAPEFTEITWANPSAGVVTGTSTTAGVPFTLVASEVTVGNGTCTSATTTAATGPNHWNDANNWDGAAVPVAADTVNVNLNLGSILYGLSQAGATLAGLNITSQGQTANTVGLPKTNAAGYTEYRTTDLTIDATLCKLDAQSPRIRLNFGSIPNSTEVRSTGQGFQGELPVAIRGTSTSNVLDVVSGQVGCAALDGESYAAATVTVGPNAFLVLGSGCAIGTQITNNGNLQSNGTFVALYTAGGQVDVRGTPGATTIDVSGGRLNVAFGGTAANVLYGPGVIDATADSTARTFTNTTARPGGQIVDQPTHTITFTNKIALGAGVVSLTAA